MPILMSHSLLHLTLIGSQILNGLFDYVSRI
jgi:hypothetical protein